MKGYRQIKRQILGLDAAKTEINPFWGDELAKGLRPELLERARDAQARRSGDGRTAPLSLWVPPPIAVDGGWQHRALGGASPASVVLAWPKPYTGGRVGTKVLKYEFKYRVVADVLRKAASAAVDLAVRREIELGKANPAWRTKCATAAVRLLQQTLGRPEDRMPSPPLAGELEKRAATWALAFAYAQTKGWGPEDYTGGAGLQLMRMIGDADLSAILSCAQGLPVDTMRLPALPDAAVEQPDDTLSDSSMYPSRTSISFDVPEREMKWRHMQVSAAQMLAPLTCTIDDLEMPGTWIEVCGRGATAAGFGEWSKPMLIQSQPEAPSPPTLYNCTATPASICVNWYPGNDGGSFSGRYEVELLLQSENFRRSDSTSELGHECKAVSRARAAAAADLLGNLDNENNASPAAVGVEITVANSDDAAVGVVSVDLCAQFPEFCRRVVVDGWDTCTTGTIRIHDTLPGEQYAIRARTIVLCGCTGPDQPSQWSSTTILRTPESISVPGEIAWLGDPMYADSTSTAITVRWAAPPPLPGTAGTLTQYCVCYRAVEHDDEERPSLVSGPDAPTPNDFSHVSMVPSILGDVDVWTLESQPPETTFWFTVRAQNAFGWGPWAAAKKGRTRAAMDAAIVAVTKSPP
eukprot:SAG31_NODE_3783_length_3883_cov_2.045983_3_plen_636_part_00